MIPNSHNSPSAGLSYVIASVYRENRSIIENAAATALLQARFKRREIPFKSVIGGYRNDNGNYKRERSFLFPIDWPVIQREFAKQESVLILRPLDRKGQRRAILHYINQNKLPVDLGWFTQVSSKAALDNYAGFTYDPEQAAYFIAIQE